MTDYVKCHQMKTASILFQRDLTKSGAPDHTQAPSGVTCDRPLSANQYLIILNLIVVSASPRNMTFNQWIWNWLVCSSELFCPTDLSCPSRKVILPEIIHSLLACHFHTLFCLQTPFILYRSLESLSICQMGCFLTHESLNKANSNFKFNQLNFLTENNNNLIC